jgi:hypothetical protein
MFTGQVSRSDIVVFGHGENVAEGILKPFSHNVEPQLRNEQRG